jgi:hypothetical protein
MVELTLPALFKIVISLIGKSHNEKLVNSDDIRVESAPLVARVQTTCAKCAQALQQEGREVECPARQRGGHGAVRAGLRLGHGNADHVQALVRYAINVRDRQVYSRCMICEQFLDSCHCFLTNTVRAPPTKPVGR